MGEPTNVCFYSIYSTYSLTLARGRSETEFLLKIWQHGTIRFRHGCFTSHNWASAWDFQQYDILTCVDSDEPLHPPFKLRNSKWRSVSSLTIIEYSSDLQRLWSDCAYAQAGLSLCWSHISHCWKSHALAETDKKVIRKKSYRLITRNQLYHHVAMAC